MIKNDRKKISVFVEEGNASQTLTCFSNEYRSLMHLIADQLMPDDFGECQGMGRCATCKIEVLESAYPLNNFDRNENSNLESDTGSLKIIRLSCQIYADELADGLKIKLVR
ncbi:2Fe-2S iron-sulfur cluster binding domain-containing protein [Pedobacter sp. ok626]|uniref:2Fe-2S iron-sulfur cluster-binding protein n=1 Tax=Pedobacter sp. ok626 TaxID=1761882 RepID=UPI0008818CBA|nr:2Fe-2S iron-sulfur cluster-binding protein [Pedobacter sp. ok626]SDL10746.1 2Fe-2S iron-sulfur cluster binding domain-containing protein [Pedobacter sp. ok626]